MSKLKTKTKKDQKYINKNHEYNSTKTIINQDHKKNKKYNS